MATANLNRETGFYDDGKDALVIVRDNGDLPGGRSLDVSGVASDVTVLRAGHVIIKSGDEYKPLGISNGQYATPSEGESYVGVLKHSVLVSDPRAAILTIGQVNAAASPWPVTGAIKTALPRIEFLY